MKLVNVDAINDTTIPMMYLDYDRNDWVQCKIVTKDAPEVKAIPIEWIKKQLKEESYLGLLIDHVEWHNCLSWLIDKWEKENE